MFSKTMLPAQVKRTAALVAFLLGCIAVLALHGPAVARGQDSDLRSELLTALELQLSVAESLGRSDLAASLEEAIEQLLFASDADLTPFEDVIDEIKNYSGALQLLDAAIQDAAAEEARPFDKRSAITNGAMPPPSLTPPSYFDGGSAGLLCRIPDATVGERVDTEVLLLARIALGTAKSVWAGLEVACGLDVLFIGTVGIGAAVCVGAAVGVAAAEEVVDGFERCDATVDEAHLDAAFVRAEDNFNLGTHTHEDLATHDADIKSLLANIQAGIDANSDKLDILLARQLEVVRLLVTPQGRRATDVPACNDGPCSWPNKKKIARR